LDWAGPGLAILVWASVVNSRELSIVHAKQWRTRLAKKKRRRKRSGPAMRCCRSRWRFYGGRQWFQAAVTPLFPYFCIASSFSFCSHASLFHLLFLTVVLLLLAVLLGSSSGCNREEREAQLAIEKKGEAVFLSILDLKISSSTMKIKSIYR